jgi:GNAT superfamily N-acetyltransferase
VPDQGKYFLHQLAVAPTARQKGLGLKLVAMIVNRLKEEHSKLTLEFTLNSDNNASKVTAEAVAREVGMNLVPNPDRIDLLDNALHEELYLLAGQ